MSATILVVDDHQLYRAAFCGSLQLCWPAAEIIEAADASQALALFSLREWSLIILDYQLPTLSGGDLARHLRARAQARGGALPPLILTSTQPDAATFARAIGAAMFLPKPIAIDDLRVALAPILDERTAEPALPRAAKAALRPLRAAPLEARTPQPARSAALATRVAPGLTARPELGQLQASLLDVVQQTLRRFPAPHAPAGRKPIQAQSSRVGDYLVQLGYLTRWQLMCALQNNQTLAQRARVPLGFTIAAHTMAPAPVISAILLQQFYDRLASARTSAPRFIGEQLLLSTDLAPAELALALQEQIDRYRQGRWVRLGEILARHGWHDPAAIGALAPCHFAPAEPS